MASTNPPKKNVAFGFELDVFDTSGNFLSGATFTSAQISKNHAAYAALTNAPAEIGTSGTYFIALTAAEMNTDQIHLRFVIASNPDIGVHIMTNARTFDDLAFPAATGNAMDVDASGRVLLQPAQPSVVIPTVTTLTNDPAGVTTLLSRLSAARAGYLDNLNTYLDLAITTVKTVVDAIKAKTDLLPSDPADESLLEAAISANTSTVTTQTDLIKAKTNLIPASPAAVGSQMDLVNAPNATAVTAIQAGLATAANLTVLLNRVGAFTGSGVNTVLGFLRAMANKAGAVVTPSDLSASGTFTNTTDSLEAIRDEGDAAWTTFAGAGVVPTAGEVADAVWDETRSGHTTAGTFGAGVASVQGNVTGSVSSVTGNVGGNIGGTVPDSAGVTTLLSRLTSTRAALLDNLAALAGFGGTLVAMLKAMARKNVTSVDLAATYDPATDSLEAAREKLDTVAAATPVTYNETIEEIGT